MKVVTDQQKDSQDADVQVYSVFQATSNVAHTRLSTSLTKTFVAALLLPKEYM